MNVPYWLFPNLYFYIAIGLFVIGWFCMVIYVCAEVADDFFDAIMLIFLFSLLGAVLAVVWPLAAFIALVWTLVSR